MKEFGLYSKGLGFKHSGHVIRFAFYGKLNGKSLEGS